MWVVEVVKNWFEPCFLMCPLSSATFILEKNNSMYPKLFHTFSSVLTIDGPFLQDPKLVYTLFYVHG